jgi:hypothetical protein
MSSALGRTVESAGTAESAGELERGAHMTGLPLVRKLQRQSGLRSGPGAVERGDDPDLQLPQSLDGSVQTGI